MVTAYLHGDLEDEIYVQPPKELLEPNQEGKVWRFKKSIYGLKQSGRNWNRKLDQTLKEFKFNPSKANPCVYIKRHQGKLVLLEVYVDDIIILSNDDCSLIATKQYLAKHFKMKDLGEAQHLLGLKITRDEQRHIWLNQRIYIKEILERFNMK